MKTEARACAAFLTGRICLGKDAETLYDCIEGRHLDIAGILDKDGVGLIECHPPMNAPVKFDDTGTRYLTYNSQRGEIYINISGNTFKGYDSGSSSLFMGKASGNLVVLYDYKEKSFFKYRLCGKDSRGWLCGAVCHDCVAAPI